MDFDDPQDRQDIFDSTANAIGFSEAVVEKDFWVCYTLDYLFHRSPWKDNLSFKGGTSLSKAYHLIKCFSEDIDIILDWRVLGYAKDEPWQKRSKTKQDAFNKDANRRTSDFLANEFAPTIRAQMSEELDRSLDIRIAAEDGQTVLFAYPQVYSTPSIMQVIRLEIGPLAAWTPANLTQIRPYVAEIFPEAFAQSSTKVLTVTPERTFWEKATILHHEANRPDYLKSPSRHSRHYYDLACMSTSPVKDIALADFKLLQKVAEFKRKFYPRGWAKYEEAAPGTLKLVPPEYRMAELKVDYSAMHPMLTGNPLSFGEMIETIRDLEREINRLGNV